MDLRPLEQKVISIFKKISLPVARLSLFIIYFWFGILKLLDASPANPLVASLLEKTLPFLDFRQFIVFFSIFEISIGICFLIPKLEKLAIALLVPHMITTFLPLIFLPQITWQRFLTPTLEGQYIIKNLIIIALVIAFMARLKPHTEEI